MQTTIDLHPKQYDFYVCPDKVAAYIGGIRSGKSYAGVLWAIEKASVPGAVVLVVAPTYPMLRDVDWVEAQKFLGTHAKISKAEMTIDIPGGGKMLFRSADTPDRIRGISANAALMDEAGYCPKDTYDIVLGRLSGGPGQLRIVTTPKGRNWLYERQGEMTIFRSTTFENTSLPIEYLETMKSTYTGNFARQELYGEFVAFEGLVYPMFSRDVHVCRREMEDVKTWYMAIDEGYTNPAVILLIGQDFDGRWHVFREWYQRGKLQHHVVSQVVEWVRKYNPSLAAVDAAAAGLIADLLDNGVPAEAAKGRVLDGIQAIQNRLMIQGDGLPGLTIDAGCINMITEFESYVWKEGRDEPVKQADHALDAIRYLNDATQMAGVEILFGA